MLPNPHILIWILAIVLFYTGLEIWRNWYLEKVLHRAPDHALNFAIRVIPVAVIWLVSIQLKANIIKAELMFIFCFWFIFDVGLAMVTGKYFYYLDGSTIDGWQKKSFGEGPWFIWKFLLALTSIAWAFGWTRIVG